MSTESSTRVRREPPRFRELAVARTEPRSPYLVRVTLSGADLAGFEPPQPAGSVRLLLPDAPGADVVIPAWNGNAFVQADGRRPLIRTLTPLRYDADAGELDVDVVLHGDGPLSVWAATCGPGDPVAMSGPGRGYSIGDEAATYVLAGDESALPAIGQLVTALPADSRATAIVEVADPGARVALGDRPSVDVRWVDRPPASSPGDALVAAIAESVITPDMRVWAAGEAAAVQRIRRHLFTTVGMSRAHATVRGYWKHGRSGDDATEG